MSTPWNMASIEKHLLVASAHITAELDKLSIPNNADILKIGIGDAQMSKHLAARAPTGQMLIVDTYQPLIDTCRKECADTPQIQIEKIHVKKMSFEKQFDVVFSFMSFAFFSSSLEIYKNIYNALKPEGKLLLIIPSKCSPVFGSFESVVKSGEIPEVIGKTIPFDIHSLEETENELSRIPFSNFKIETPLLHTKLPSLQTFRDFLSLLSNRFEKELSHETMMKVQDAQTRVFNEVCQKNHNGQYVFEFMPFVITAVK